MCYYHLGSIPIFFLKKQKQKQNKTKQKPYVCLTTTTLDSATSHSLLRSFMGFLIQITCGRFFIAFRLKDIFPHNVKSLHFHKILEFTKLFTYNIYVYP